MPEQMNLSGFKARLGPANETQARLLLQVSPAQRLQAMLEMEAVILNTWQARLRQAYPELSDLELCRLLFKRLQQDH